MSDWDSFAAWFEEHHPRRSQSLEALRHYGEAVIDHPAALISTGDKSRFWTRHLQECIHPDLVEVLPPGGRVLDVGSGNGLPGLPLSILRPDVEVTLLEPRQRKAGFLEQEVLSLGLVQTRVVAASLEELAMRRPAPFDAFLSRALLWTPNLIEALETLSSLEAVLYRFGPGRGNAGDISLEGRAVQVLPRADWDKAL